MSVKFREALDKQNQNSSHSQRDSDTRCVEKVFLNPTSKHGTYNQGGARHQTELHYAGYSRESWSEPLARILQSDREIFEKAGKA
jgi:hypothetical protein